MGYATRMPVEVEWGTEHKILESVIRSDSDRESFQHRLQLYLMSANIEDRPILVTVKFIKPPEKGLRRV